MPQDDPYAKIAQPLATDDPYARIASPKGASAANPTFGEYMKNVGIGALRGVANTVSGLDDFATKHLPTFMTTPIGQAATPENSARATAYAKQLATPENPIQSFGKGVEQAAEFVAPTALEGKVASKILSVAPRLGKAAAKIIPAALSAGAVNSMQGGSFGTGAAAGGVGAGIAEGASALAPVIAEKALGVTSKLRGFGRTPGEAIIAETQGVRPSTVAKSAQSVVDADTAANQALANAHTGPVSIQPALDSVDRDIATTQRQNNTGGYNLLQPVKGQLTENPFALNQPFAAPTVGNPNAVISPMQTASGALNLKRGLRNQFVKNWSPLAGPSTAADSAKTASRAIDQQLDSALGPEFAQRNQRISSLIPVVDRANAVDLHDGPLARAVGRIGAHTGAGALGIAGAFEGRREGGTTGAVIGGLTGLLAPELLANPTTMMVGARTAASPFAPYIARLATASALQANRRSE